MTLKDYEDIRKQLRELVVYIENNSSGKIFTLMLKIPYPILRQMKAESQDTLTQVLLSLIRTGLKDM